MIAYLNFNSFLNLEECLYFMVKTLRINHLKNLKWIDYYVCDASLVFSNGHCTFIFTNFYDH